MLSFRERSFIMSRGGGAQNGREGDQVMFYLYVIFKGGGGAKRF